MFRKIKMLSLMSVILVSCSKNSNNLKPNLEPGKESEAKQPTTNFLSVTDIHFNPYSLCEKEETAGLDSSTSKCAAMMQELIQTSGDQWEKVFEKYMGQEKAATVGEHTNYSLFRLFLNQLENVAKSQNVEFVFLLGDFLVYNFENKFASYSKLSDPQSLETFTKNTFSFISESISRKLGKNIEIYPVLGNTDSYVSNYNFDNPLSTNLYRDLSLIWGKNNVQLTQSSSFITGGGYYSIKLSKKNLTLLALNTTMFAREVRSNQSIDVDSYAQKQLDWLSDELNKNDLNENKNSNNKFIIISHIPAGISAASSKRLNSPTSFWRNNSFETKYLNLLNNNANSMAGIFLGHTHEDIFQIINKNSELASSTTPSLTSSRQDARFRIFKLDKNNVLVDSILYSFNPSNNIWREESFSTSYPQAKNIFQVYMEQLNKMMKNTSALQNKKEEICAASSGMTSATYTTCLNNLKSN